MRAEKLSAAAHHLDFALLGERRESAGQPLHDAGLPGAQLVEIELRLAEDDAVRAHRVRILDDLGRVQQRLGRDAADIQAHAAERS